jgi:hypothetical protein
MAAGDTSLVANPTAVWHQDESGRVHTRFEPVVHHSIGRGQTPTIITAAPPDQAPGSCSRSRGRWRRSDATRAEPYLHSWGSAREANIYAGSIGLSTTGQPRRALSALALSLTTGAAYPGRYSRLVTERREICLDCGRVLDPEVDEDFLTEVTWFERRGSNDDHDVEPTGRLLCESCAWARVRAEEWNA